MLRFHNNSIGSAFRNLKGKIRSCRSISGINRCAILSGNHHARGAAACFKVNLQGVPFFQLQRMYIAPGHLMKIQKVAFRVFDAYTGKAGLIEAACEDCGSRNQKQQTANQNPFVTFHFDLRYGALFLMLLPTAKPIGIPREIPIPVLLPKDVPMAVPKHIPRHIPSVP